MRKLRAAAAMVAATVGLGVGLASQSDAATNATSCPWPAYVHPGVFVIADHDYARAVALVLPCAEMGDAEFEFAFALLKLQWIYDRRALTPPDFTYAEVLVWVYRAVREGKAPQAASFLSDGYEWGRYGLPKNDELKECWGRVAHENDVGRRAQAVEICHVKERDLSR